MTDKPICSTKFSELSFEELRQKIYDFSTERDWHKHHAPRNVLLAMNAEVGELNECFQWKGEVLPGLVDKDGNEWDEKEKEHLGEEMSDVIMYLFCLADVCKIDLSKAVLDKMKKNVKKYPVVKSIKK